MASGLLVLTHSSRPVDRERCSLDFLTRRYADPQRLSRLPPFESLPPSRDFAAYYGAVSLFRVEAHDWRQPSVRYLGSIRQHDKVQHTSMLDRQTMLATFEDRLELWQVNVDLAVAGRWRASDVSVVKRIEHPHFAGLHTGMAIGDGQVAVSASAADAVFLVDLTSGQVARMLCMPCELYGQSYPLSPEMDLHAHYIANDHQATHINAAAPFPDGKRLVVSTLIQGAVGIFNLTDGSYREVLRGFVGCHGARVNHQGEVYFADSPRGALVVIDEQGRILRRFGVPSCWLHDVQHLEGDVYAFTLSDRNQVRIYDTASGRLLYRRRFLCIPFQTGSRLWGRLPGRVGNSTQFLDYLPLK